MPLKHPGSNLIFHALPMRERTLNSLKSRIEDNQNKLRMDNHRFYSTGVSGLVYLVLKEAFKELQRDLKRNSYFPRINRITKQALEPSLSG
jgi:hypothetical protein